VSIFPLLLDGVDVVVSEDDEVACFRHVAEILHGLVDCRQLSIVRAVFLLGQVEFLGEGERLSGVLDTLLQHGNHG
jgi:hypothetical protein